MYIELKKCENEEINNPINSKQPNDLNKIIINKKAKKKKIPKNSKTRRAKNYEKRGKY